MNLQPEDYPTRSVVQRLPGSFTSFSLLFLPLTQIALTFDPLWSATLVHAYCYIHTVTPDSYGIVSGAARSSRHGALPACFLYTYNFVKRRWVTVGGAGE